jgi:hypothetical protein
MASMTDHSEGERSLALTLTPVLQERLSPKGLDPAGPGQSPRSNGPVSFMARKCIIAGHVRFWTGQLSYWGDRSV